MGINLKIISKNKLVLFKHKNMRSFKRLMFLISIFFLGTVQAKEIVVSGKIGVDDFAVGAGFGLEIPLIGLIADPSTPYTDVFEDKKIVNRIILSINNKHSNYQATDYTAEVKLNIMRRIWNGAGFTDYPEVKTLKVDYSQNSPYKDKAILQYEGGHILGVTIMSVTPSLGSTVMNLELESQIYVERYFKLDIDQIPTINHNTSYVSSRNELEVTWDNIQGAEEYELEWTYVNNLAENGTYVSASQVEITPEIFRSNNTRVSITDRSEHGGTSVSYRIPLIYEQGFILYRVRAVGVHEDDVTKIKTGAWSIDGVDFHKVSEFKQGTQNHYYYNSVGHEKKLNWQSSVTFIEEGKNKVAVSYADGTLRSRQQVSRLNQEDETVVGESVYDHQGRKAIDIIPAPTGNVKIGFQPGFNKNTSGDSYSRDDFDKDVNDKCDLKAGALSTNSGAGQYYSPNNPIKDGENAYIPDAKGYPFIHTVYTNDNTGRIRFQGGIGADHQIGSAHETKNFYGRPFQEEVDRMFGSEAGVASHYQKNLVVDPNGQVTVSYLDLQGNVVATSLAGDASNTPQLKALLSNKSTGLNVDLLKPQYNKEGDLIPVQYRSTDKYSKIYSQEMLVSKTGERTFEYNITPEKYELDCEIGETVTPVCFNCVYNVEILIEDKCGEQFFYRYNSSDPAAEKEFPFEAGKKITIGQSLVDEIENGNIINITDCSREIVQGPINANPTFEKVGDYRVTKVLTVNKQVLSHYTEEFLKLNCHRTLEDFEAEKAALIDQEGCGQDCDKCLERLGEYDQYDINANPNCDPCLSYKEYQDKVELCETLCEDEPINCSSLLDAMLSDVTPLGQYGLLYDGDTETEDFDAHPLSVYNLSNNLPANESSTANWKNPVDWRTGTPGYFNDNGKRAVVQYEVTLNGSGGYSTNPEVILDFDPTESGIFETEIERLVNFEDFLYRWQDNFAHSLVQYHPEWKAYEYCQENIKSHTFDDVLTYSTSMIDFKVRYEKAFDVVVTDDRLFDFAGVSGSPIDPYFQSADNVNYSNIEHLIAKYFCNNYKRNDDNTISYSILEYTRLIHNCPQADLSGGACSDASLCLSSVAGNPLTDEEFTIYKSLYLSLKQKLEERKRVLKSINEEWYGGCIGMESWNAFSGDIMGGIPFSGGVLPSQFFNPAQPCAYSRYKLFKDKKPRSITLNQLMAQNDGGLAIEECFVQGALDTDGDGTDDLTVEDNEMVDFNCNERDELLFERGNIVADKGLLDACGECPITRDIEYLLNAVVTNNTNGLVTVNTPLGCYPLGLAEWTEDLELAAGLPSGPTPDQYDFHLISASTSVYTAEITNSGPERLTLQLAQKPSYQYVDYSDGNTKTIDSIPWQNIKGLCCAAYSSDLEVLVADGGDPDGNKKTFVISATVEIEQADGSFRDIKIQLEGLTDKIILNECSSTLCSANELGADLANFFNGMLFKASGHPSLFTNSTLTELSATSNSERFALITDLMKNAASPSVTTSIIRWDWQASTTSTSLDINITPYKDNAGVAESTGLINVSFQTLDATSINFDQITRFKLMRPLELTSPVLDDYDTKDFEVIAELKDGSGNISSVILKGSSMAFNVGNCEVFGYESPSAP